MLHFFRDIFDQVKADIRLMKEELAGIERYRGPKERSLDQYASSLEAMQTTKEGLESELHQVQHPSVVQHMCPCGGLVTKPQDFCPFCYSTCNMGAEYILDYKCVAEQLAQAVMPLTCI